MKLTCKMNYTRSTKGTHVFTEVNARGEEVKEVIGSLYIQRTAMKGEPNGMTITVTVEAK